VKLVALVEHELKSTKEGNEMGKKNEWRVEIYRNGDVLEWTLYRVVDGVWLPLEGNTNLTVSDMFREAGQVLEGELPEIFA
jgi:hypothetical protein